MRIWKNGDSSLVELAVKRRSVLGLKCGVRAWLKCALGAKLWWDVRRDWVLRSLTGIRWGQLGFNVTFAGLSAKWHINRRTVDRNHILWQHLSLSASCYLFRLSVQRTSYVSTPPWIEKDEDIGTGGENKLLTVEYSVATERSHLDQNPPNFLDFTRFPSSRLHFLLTRFVETRSQWAGTHLAAVAEY